MLKPFRFLRCLCLLASLWATSTLFAGERMTPELLWKLGRIGDVAVSPDGTAIAYTVTHYDLEANGGKADLYLQSVPALPNAARLQEMKRSIGFETALLKSSPKVLLQGIKGLSSVGWIQRPKVHG